MALTYTGTNGIFTILGKAFFAHKTLGTVRSATVKQEVLDFVNAYKAKTNATLDFDRSVDAAAKAELSWRTAGDAMAAALQRDCQGFLREAAKADSELVRDDLTAALQYLIDEMEDDSYHVTANTVSATYVAVAGNSATDLVLKVSIKNHLARQSDTFIVEVLEVICTSGGLAIADADAAVLRIRGERAARSKLAEDWPTGSGISKTIRPLTISDSVLLNGGFEEAEITNAPDDWIPDVMGTGLELTKYEKQSITISGTPTAGFYGIKILDPVTGFYHSTENIVYNDDGSGVQTALRELPLTVQSLEEVTVATTGISPNYVHTIEFVGVAGNLGAVMVSNHTTGGSFVIAEVQAGDPLPIKGRGLKFMAHATELTTIYQPVDIDPDKVYFLGYWMTPTAAGTGQFEVAIVNSIGGVTLTDRSGANISELTNLSGLSAKTGKGFFFAVKPSTQGQLYVVLRKTIAEPTRNFVVDEVVLVQATELYPGGPFVAAMAGSRPVLKEDAWNLTVTNNNASEFQKYFDAFFDTAGKRLLLPTSGSNSISEALVG
jgi:hypothetical protein